MDIQFQIRQNAMEMQEYMKDLFDWQRSIKKKERAVKASGADDPAEAPAPRGRANGAVSQAPAELMQPALGPKAASSTTSTPAPKPKPESTAQGPNNQGAQRDVIAKTAAAHTHSSYHKWEKFDVDAALASDDEDTPSGSKQKQSSKAAAGGTQSGVSKPSTSNGKATTAVPAAAPQPRSQPAAAAAPSSTLSSPLPPTAPSGISLTAHDPSQPQGDDLLRPVSTTRLTAKPPTTSAAAKAPPSGDRDPSSAAPAPSAASSANTTAAAAAAPAAALPPIRNSQPTTADAWRARGNDLFKAGEYDSAFECYSRSVEMQPTCLGHANRAMALLKLGRWQEAVSDCTAALQLDPAYVKAYQRRAAAHRQLGASLEAARDWEQALRLEPENRATAADRDAALGLLWEQQKLQPPSRRVGVPLVVGAPAAAEAAVAEVVPEGVEQQQQGTSRGGSSGGKDAALQTSTAAAPVVLRQPEELLGRSAAATASGGEAAVAAAAPSSLPAASATPPPEPSAPHPQGSTSQPTPSAAPSSSAAPAAIAATAASPSSAAASATATVTHVVPPAAASPSPALPAVAAARGVPRTSVEFESAWRTLGTDPRVQAAYLSAIPPASLSTVFKNSLTAPVLAAMVRCLLAGMTPPPSYPSPPAQHEALEQLHPQQAAAAEAGGPAEAGTGAEGCVSPAQGLALLEGLSRVSRFDLMAMAVPSRERAELRAAWDKLEEAWGRKRGRGGQEEEAEGGSAEAGALEGLRALRKKYRL